MLICKNTQCVSVSKILYGYKCAPKHHLFDAQTQTCHSMPFFLFFGVFDVR